MNYIIIVVAFKSFSTHAECSRNFSVMKFLAYVLARMCFVLRGS